MVPSALHVAGEVTASAAVLAGLLLVFLGATSNSFESYTKTEQNTVRRRYQRRARFAFTGLAFALLSASLALAAKWFGEPVAATTAIIILFISLIWVVFAALFAMREIN